MLGQEAVEHKSNEIPTVRTLTLGLDLKGRVVTVDAMHVQHETARCVVESCGAHYVMTAVKSNQPNLLIELQGLHWELPEVRTTEHRTANKGHGRIEKRSCRVLDLTDHPDKARLPHRTVAFRIERERRNAKTGKVEHETVHGLTSLPPDGGARGGTGASVCTTCATSPITKTGAGCVPVICRATSPA